MVRIGNGVGSAGLSGVHVGGGVMGTVCRCGAARELVQIGILLQRSLAATSPARTNPTFFPFGRDDHMTHALLPASPLHTMRSVAPDIKTEMVSPWLSPTTMLRRQQSARLLGDCHEGTWVSAN